MLVASAFIFGEPADASSVRNNIEVYSNTAGNSGDSVKTGPVSARSSVKTEINNDGEEDKIDVKTQVKAQANGEAVEIKTEGSEPVSLEKENDGAKASVKVETSQIDSDLPISGESANDATNNLEEAGIVVRIIDKIKSFFNSIFS